MREFILNVVKIIFYCLGVVCLAGVLLFILTGHSDSGKLIWDIEDIKFLLSYWYMLSFCGVLAYTGIYIANIVYKHMNK